MKTAIRIITERDRELVIPYFESIDPSCNISIGDVLWEVEDIKIGEVWLIDRDGDLNVYESQSYVDISDYTIIDGVPEDFSLPKSREQELEEHLRNICNELTGEQECEIELEKGLGIRLSNLVIKAKQLLNTQ